MAGQAEVIFSAEGGEQLPEKTGQQIPLEESGLTGWVIRNQRGLVIDDLQEEPLPAVPRPGGEAYLSWLGVPLMSGEEVLGAITVDAVDPGLFTERHRKLLESVAAQVAISVQNQRLFQEAERRLSTLQGLRSVDRAISNSLGLDVTLEVLLDQTLAHLQVDAAAVLLMQPQLQALEYQAGKGFHSGQIRETYLSLGEGYAGRAALERAMVKVPDLDQAAPPFTRRELVQTESFVSYYVVPLVSKGKIKGVLEVFQRSPLQPDQEWFDLLETLAGQAAIAVDSAQLFEELQRANMELIMAYDRSLEGWARTLELRDLETEGHSRRVTEMTVRLAREMGVRREKISDIYRGALLHDIGKMGIPDRILHKEGPLDDEEWDLMKTHPLLAHELLSDIPYLENAVEIPYSHHERWDGSGYPQGLEGEQIPLAARIFAVVDVWDALKSERPYREAWPEEKVLDYLREQAGQEFDPAVVEAFLKLQDQPGLESGAQ
jgi:HD-GYP domain-containing protein (c-di-GMP phosphodiesterase class II)